MEKNYGWVIVAAGALITCVAMGAMFALPVYLQPMSDDTGWGRAGISTAMTIAFIAMGISGFVWGTIADRIGPRPVVLIGAIMLGVGLFIASRAPNLLVFEIAYGGLCGASIGAFFAPIMATTLAWFDKNRGLAVSLVSIGAGVAPMVITPLASVLISTYGWRSAMLIVAIGAWTILVPASFLIRRAPAAALVTQTGTPASTSRSAIAATLRQPQFIVLATVFALCCAAHSGPIFHTVSYAVLCGASSLAAASIYSVEGVAGLFGRLLFGLMADKFGVKRVIVAGLVLQAAGIYSYIYVSQLNHFFLLAAVLGMAYGGVMPLYDVLAGEYFGPKVMGTVLGGITMTSSIGMAIGPLGGGWIFDTFGDYHWLYVASAAIGLAAAAVALAFPRSGEPHGEPPDALPA